MINNLKQLKISLMKKQIIIFLASVYPCIAMSADTDSFKIITGINYSTGKYGQKTSTDITSIPFIGKYEHNNFTFKVSVPWLKIVGDGSVTGGDGLVIANNNTSKRTSESGLGDIVTSISYSAIELPSDKFLLETTAKIKFGTASSKRGLGTGENDYTLQADAYKTLDKATLMATLGYKVLGDPDYINLNNVWFGSLGVAYKFNQKNSVGAYIDLRQATSNSSTNLREYTIYHFYKINPNYNLQSYLTHGDTRSSTDWGGGILLGYRW
jgi:hypothetical protein